tara:strand:+ start:2405 stop:3625 length:1221 start_codon:yes stop_codon:yes gene_type:complete
MKKKLNVLLIAQNFWPENFPINSIVKSLSSKINFTVITGKPNYPLGEFYKGYKKYGIILQNYNQSNRIIRVPIFPRKKATSLQLFLNYISFLFSGIFFGYFYTLRKKFDYILVYCPSPATQIGIGVFFKIIKKVKLVTWVQDIWPESLFATDHFNKKRYKGFLNYIFHYLYKKNDLLLVQSNSFKNHFIKNNISDKVLVVPNAAEKIVTNYKKDNKKYLDKNFFNITYTGNIGKAQSFKNFCLAANNIYLKNRNINFNIFGEGKSKNLLINDIKRHNNKNIKVFDFVEKSKLIKIYKKSDVLLIMLKNKNILNMTIPSKFQNYLIHKKPILGWVSGQTKKIIEDNKCGLTANPNNIKEFENAVLKFYRLYKFKKLNNFSLNSYKLYKENYTNKKICHLIIKSLKEC